MKKLMLIGLLIIGITSEAIAGESGVMRGSDDGGATKRVLKTKSDGTLVVEWQPAVSGDIVVTQGGVTATIQPDAEPWAWIPQATTWLLLLQAVVYQAALLQKAPPRPLA